MENVYKQQPGLLRLRAIAIREWLMVLPATVLLAAAALRTFQPRQYEPARTSWIIFEWTMTHISRLGAAILFIGMPGVVVAAGCAALLRCDRPTPFCIRLIDRCCAACRNNPYGCGSSHGYRLTASPTRQLPGEMKSNLCHALLN